MVTSLHPTAHAYGSIPPRTWRASFAGDHEPGALRHLRKQPRQLLVAEVVQEQVRDDGIDRPGSSVGKKFENVGADGFGAPLQGGNAVAGGFADDVLPVLQRSPHDVTPIRSASRPRAGACAVKLPVTATEVGDGLRLPGRRRVTSVADAVQAALRMQALTRVRSQRERMSAGAIRRAVDRGVTGSTRRGRP